MITKSLLDYRPGTRLAKQCDNENLRISNHSIAMNMIYHIRVKVQEEFEESIRQLKRLTKLRPSDKNNKALYNERIINNKLIEEIERYYPGKEIKKICKDLRIS